MATLSREDLRKNIQLQAAGNTAALSASKEEEEEKKNVLSRKTLREAIKNGATVAYRDPDKYNLNQIIGVSNIDRMYYDITGVDPTNKAQYEQYKFDSGYDSLTKQQKDLIDLYAQNQASYNGFAIAGMSGDMQRVASNNRNYRQQLLDSGMSEEDITKYVQDKAKNQPNSISNWWNNLKAKATEKTEKAMTEQQEKTDAADKKYNALSQEQKDLLNSYAENSRAYEGFTYSGLGGYMPGFAQSEMLSASSKMHESKQALLDTGLSENDIADLIDYTQKMQNKEIALKNTESAKKAVDEGNIASNAGLDLVSVMAQPINSVAGGVNALSLLMGQAPDYNSTLNQAGRIATDIRQSRTDNMKTDAGKILYNGIMSGVDNIYLASGLTAGLEGIGMGSKAAGKLAGGLITSGYGLSSFSSSYADAINNGIPEENAIKLATANGVAEAATEYIGIDLLVSAMASPDPKVKLASILGQMLVQMGCEGSEEVVNSIVSNAADILINGDYSDYEQNVARYGKEEAQNIFKQELLESGITGAIGGAVGSGGATIVRLTTNSKNAVNLLKNQDFAELADAIDTNADSYENEQQIRDANIAKEKATELAAKQEAGEKITVEDKRQMYELMGITMDNASQTEASMNKLEKPSIVVPISAENDIKVPEEYKFNAFDDYETAYEALTNADNILSFADAYKKTVNSTNNDIKQYLELDAITNIKLNLFKKSMADLEQILKYPTTEDVYKMAVNNQIDEGQAASYGPEYRSAYAAGKLVYNEKYAAAADEAKKAPVDVIKASISVDGKNSIVKGFTADGKLNTSVGAIDIANADFNNAATKRIYFAASEYSPEIANIFIENAPVNVPADSYIRYMNNAYRFGQQGNSWDAAKKQAYFILDKVDESVIKKMYEEGVAEQKGQQKKVNKSRNNTVSRKGEGKVINENNIDTPLMPLYEGIAAATGLDVVIDNSIEERGSFNKSLSTIVLNPESKGAYETLFHELTEFIEGYNPSGMADVRQAMIDYLVDKDSAWTNKRIDEYASAYAKVEGQKTIKEAAEEFENDAVVGILGSEEGIRDFGNYLANKKGVKEAKRIFNTIADFFKSLADKFSEFIGNQKLSKQARMLAEMKKSEAMELRQNILDALDVAIENYQNQDVTEPNNADKRLSIEVDLETELKKYGQLKYNDFVNVQKNIINKLTDENFFDNNAIKVKDSDYVISITMKGIKETFNKNNFQKLPRFYKELKIGTIGSIKKIISESHKVNSKSNYHAGKNQSFSYFECDILINGIDCTVEFQVKEGGKNKFWVHFIDIKNTPNLTSVSQGNQNYKSFGASQSTISSLRNSVNVPSDEDYLSAVDSGDMQAAQNMVDVSAKNSRWNSPKLYHGTQQFGFTVINPTRGDDEISFFTTSDPLIAGTYAGKNDVTAINSKANLDVEGMTAQELADYATKNLGETYTVTDLSERVKPAYNFVFKTANDLMDLSNNYNVGLAKELADNMWKLLQSEIGSEEYMNYREKISDLYNGNNSIEKQVIDNSDTVKMGRALKAIDDMVDFSKGVWYQSGTRLVSEYNLKNYIRKDMKTGIYSFYADLSGLKEVDGAGSNWSAIGSHEAILLAKMVDFVQSYVDPDLSADDVLMSVRDMSFTDVVNMADNELKENSYEEIPADVLDSYLNIARVLDSKMEDYIMNRKNGDPSYEEYMSSQATKTTREIAQEAYDEGYKGVVIKNIRDSGGRTTYNEVGDIYVFFDGNDLKSADAATYDDFGNLIPLSERFTENSDIRFSVDVPYEQAGDFLAIHNMQPEELMKTIELGGFPMPSIAVVKANMQHSDYGSISIIFPSDTIDPTVSNYNKIYSGDAWTPTFPTIEMHVEDKQASELYSKMIKLTEKPGILMPNSVNWEPSNFDEKLQRVGSIDALIDEYKDSIEMKQLFLSTTDEQLLDYPKKEVDAYPSDWEKLRAQYISMYLPDNYSEMTEAEQRQYVLDEADNLKEILAVAWMESKNTTIEKARNLTGKLQFLRLRQIVDSASTYVPEKTTKLENDVDAAKEIINSRVDEAKFSDWLHSIFDNLTIQTGIRNNKDKYTNNGRRSWSQLHNEINLENIVEAMRSQQQKGIGAFGLGQPIAAATYEFKSLDDVRSRENQLSVLEAQQYDEIRQGFVDRFTEIANGYAEGQDRFGASLDAGRDLCDAMAASKTKTGLKNQLKKDAAYWNYSDDLVDDLWSLIQDIQQMPTGYFEAKPQRAVGLNEIAYVVIPDNSTEELKLMLSSNGVQYEEYISGDEQSRVEIVNSRPEVRFSLPLFDDDVALTEDERAQIQSDLWQNTRSRNAGIKAINQERIHCINNKLVYTNRSAQNPLVHRIIEFKAEDYDVLSELQGVWIEYERDNTLRRAKYQKIQQGLTNYFQNGVLGSVNIFINEYGSSNPHAGNVNRGERTISRGTFTNPSARGKRRRIPEKFTSLISTDENVRNSIEVPEDEVFRRLRFSVGVDEFGTDIFNMDATSIIEEGAKVLKGQDVDKALVGRIAEKYVKQTKSKYDVEKLTDNLTKVFAYLQTGDYVNYSDLEKLITEVARPVVEESYVKDPAQKREYDEFRKAVKAYKFKLSDVQKKAVAEQYGTLTNFKVKNRKYLNFSEDGVEMDSVWSELKELSGFSLKDVSDADEPLALIDAIEAKEPQLISSWHGNEGDAAKDLAMQIMADYYDANNEKKTSDKFKLFAESYQMSVERAYANKFARLLQQHHQMNSYTPEEKERIENLRLSDPNHPDVVTYDANKLSGENTAQEDELVKRALAALSGNHAKTYTSQENINALQNASRSAALHNQHMDDVEEMTISEMKKKINRVGGQLITMLNNPTDKKHVPEGLKRPVGEFIASIDFVSQKARPDSQNTLKWKAKMKALQETLSTMTSGDNEDKMLNYMGNTLDPDLAVSMKEFIDNYGAIARLGNLDAAGLKELNRILTGLRVQINKINSTYANKRYQKMEDLVTDSFNDMRQKKSRIDKNGVSNWVKDHFIVDMMDSVTYFEELGPAAVSIYDELRDGFNTRVNRIDEASSWYSSMVDELGIDRAKFKEWTGNKAKIHKFDFVGVMREDVHIEMTTAQIMELRNLMAREQAKNHILVGGFRIGHIEGEYNNQLNVAHLFESDIKKILAVLTPEENAIAAKMQQYLSTDVSDWGNKVTLDAYGYKKFNEKTYWPIKSDSNSLAASDKNIGDNVSLNAIKNMSASKAIIEGANNAIVINDAFDTFSNHVASMATYEGMMLPLADTMQWYNFLEKSIGSNTDGKTRYDATIKKQIERIYGGRGQQWFIQFIKNINGDAMNAMDKSILSKFTSNYKAAAVSANIRVVVQQPTAIVRAANEMDGKYLANAALNLTEAKKLAAKAQEKSAIAKWKSWGYFESMLGQSMKQVITDQSTTTEQIKDVASKGAQLADDLTWGILYKAVELEIEDTTTYRPGTKEFDDAVIKRFDYIIDHTQVVDTTFHRSALMRSKSEINQMLTAFMMEPTKTYNMLYRAFANGDKDKIKRAIITYLINAIMVSAAAAVVDGFRSDDDKTSYGERWLTAFLENSRDNVNPLNMVPVLKEVVSALNGYDPARMDVGFIYDSISMIQQVAKFASGNSKKTPYGMFKLVAKSLSGVLGIPLYSATREVETIYNNVGNFFGLSNLDTSYSNATKYKKIDLSIKNGENIADEVKAVLDGEEDKDKAKSAIKSHLTSTYKQQLIDLYATDKTKALALKKKLIEAYVAAGDTREKANKKINDWFK